VCQQVQYRAALGSFEAGAALHDISRFAMTEPRQRIGMGYTATDEPVTYIRPYLVFRDNDYFLDAPAVQELQMSGLTLPAATLEQLAACRERFWVFPKNAEPFSALNKYPSAGGRPLFDAEFRRVFFKTYEPATETEYFQVWRCRDARETIAK
jgi:hypothetical protein